MKKKLVVIYFHTEDGAEITLSDYEQFYLELRKIRLLKMRKLRLRISFVPMPWF